MFEVRVTNNFKLSYELIRYINNGDDEQNWETRYLVYCEFLVFLVCTQPWIKISGGRKVVLSRMQMHLYLPQIS